jgi:hypothetical protein
MKNTKLHLGLLEDGNVQNFCLSDSTINSLESSNIAKAIALNNTSYAFIAAMLGILAAKNTVKYKEVVDLLKRGKQSGKDYLGGEITDSILKIAEAAWEEREKNAGIYIGSLEFTHISYFSASSFKYKPLIKRFIENIYNTERKEVIYEENSAYLIPYEYITQEIMIEGTEVRELNRILSLLIKKKLANLKTGIPPLVRNRIRYLQYNPMREYKNVRSYTPRTLRLFDKLFYLRKGYFWEIMNGINIPYRKLYRRKI